MLDCVLAITMALHKQFDQAKSLCRQYCAKNTQRGTGGASGLDKYPSYINKPSSSGETALHKAASKGNLDCIKLLIERGANANVLDKQGRTPLLLAWEHEHYECHKQMLISLK